MASKIRKGIVEILNEENELRAYQIVKKLAEKEYKTSYDTVSKHLKQMTEEGILKREIRKANLYPMRTCIPWYFHYSLKNTKVVRNDGLGNLY